MKIWLEKYGLAAVCGLLFFITVVNDDTYRRLMQNSEDSIYKLKSIVIAQQQYIYRLDNKIFILRSQIMPASFKNRRAPKW